MAGNVWEWVSDGYDPAAYGRGDAKDPAIAPNGPYGVLRGGSWDFAATRLASTFRLKYEALAGHVSTGFRCVVDEASASGVTEVSEVAAGPDDTSPAQRQAESLLEARSNRCMNEICPRKCGQNPVCTANCVSDCVDRNIDKFMNDPW